MSQGKIGVPTEIGRAARRIARSSHFVGSWYAATYPDVAATGLRASEHHALVGARLGRNPSARFDARFYSETNGDLIGRGIGPLLHYIEEGQAAGRPKREWDQLPEVHRLSRHLWGGLPGAAAAALDAIIADPGFGERARCEALAERAARLEFDGDPGGAAGLLARAEAAAPRWGRSKGVRLRRGALAAQMGDAALARACLEAIAPMPDGAPDIDAALMLTALVEDDAARLAALNAVLARCGLEALRRRDAEAPLALANVVAEPAPRSLPYLGRVSVIMPVFRAAELIGVAVRSLLAQSYPDLEILVVDDASDDGTFEAALALSREDGRVRALRAPRNGGAYAARNIGLAQATGAFVTTHDADDWSHPRKIETQLRAFLGRPGLMACAVSWARVRADLRPTTSWRLADFVLHISYSSLMLRREGAQRLGPWDEVRAGADWEYLARLRRVFGEASFEHVAPRLPLAFGLDEAGSLTRAKATHLVTNYHGLRHVYREIVRHHLAGPDPLDPDAQALKMRRVPPEMRGVPRGAAPLALCLAGDLFSAGVVRRMAAILGDPALGGGRVGLLHVPELDSAARHFPAALWDLVDGERVSLLVEAPGPSGAGRVVRVEGEPLGRACPPPPGPGEGDEAPWAEDDEEQEER